MNERSRECQNKLPLNDIEVFPDKKNEKNIKFIIVRKKKKYKNTIFLCNNIDNSNNFYQKVSNPPKTYKFMADSPKEKTIWIKAIKMEIEKSRNNTDEEIVQMQVFHLYRLKIKI